MCYIIFEWPLRKKIISQTIDYHNAKSQYDVTMLWLYLQFRVMDFLQICLQSTVKLGVKGLWGTKGHFPIYFFLNWIIML